MNNFTKHNVDFEINKLRKKNFMQNIKIIFFFKNSTNVCQFFDQNIMSHENVVTKTNDYNIV